MKYSIHFYLHPRPRKDGRAIKLSLTYSGKRFEAILPFHIPEGYWDSKKQECKPSWRDAAKYNMHITLVKKSIQDLFFAKMSTFSTPTEAEIKVALGLAKPDASQNETLLLQEVFNTYIVKQSVKSQWSINTKKNMTTVKNSLAKFNPGLQLSDITEDTIDDLVAWLGKSGMTNYSIDSFLRKFRRFLRWAFDKKYTDNRTGIDYRPTLHFAFDEPLYLKPEELNTLEHCELSERLQITRDAFVFCCFSGLRYSDICQLRKSQIHDDYFEIITEKTNDTLKIELNSHTRTIIDHYADNPGRYAIPVKSGQLTNRELKEIGKIAGLDRTVIKTSYIGGGRNIEELTLAEALTFHVARKTFITLALYLDIQPEVFMKWTGHKSFSSVKRYLAVVDKLREESMKKFDTL